MEDQGELQIQLIQAIIDKDVPKVESLLKLKADPNVSADHKLPIISAATTGCEKILKLLHKHHCCLTTLDTGYYNWQKCRVFDSKGRPIHIASAEGHLSFVKKLIKYGVEVNSGDQGNMTALHWAAKEGKDIVCTYLLSVGADVNAAQDGHLSTPLIYANAMSTCRLLIQYGASVNMADKAAWTPLHTAAFCKKFDKVKLLVEAGADINALTTKLENVVHKSAMNPHCPDLLTYFIKLGVDTDTENADGHTPFYISVKYINYEYAFILVKHSAKFKTESLNCKSPLRLAVEMANEKFIDLMLENGYNCSSEKWIHDREFPPKLVLADRQDIQDKLIYNASNPRNLKDMCLLFIRCLFKKNLDQVEELDLPKTLKSQIINAVVTFHINKFS